MWRLAVLASVFGFGASGAAAAPRAAAPSADILARAAFASSASASSASADDPAPVGRLLDRETYASGGGVVRWDTTEALLSPRRVSGPVDSVRLRVGSVAGEAGGLLIPGRAEFAPRDYEVTMVRRWPGALRFEAGKLDVDLSPHAGVGVTSRGGSSAEAGATISFSQRAADRLKALGVRDGAAFGDQGRWYIFASASGRAVGFNMLHREDGWNRAGWSTDPMSRLVGDTQVGVGWRKGPLQTSLGLVHREVKTSHLPYGIDPNSSDTMVGLSFSVRPHP